MLALVLILPIVSALICYAVKSAKLLGYVSLACSMSLAAASAPLLFSAFSTPAALAGGALYMDALSAYMASIIVFLSLASSFYSVGYLENEYSLALTDLKGMKRYYALFHIFVFTMLLVTVSNNLALMWMAIEATTIVSALLIGLGFYKRPKAIEAAWKYIILCTVGITFALLGTFITYYASIAATSGEGVLDWTGLKEISGKLNPATMKLAFIFILVGYGTKAGLAPVHNWLPDAHSEAPSPISALLSGILLNTSFYGIIRFVSIVEPSTGSAFTGGLLVLFGLISVALSAVFILVQDNYKRLLAYSSIEHMGIISLGVGIGGPAGLYASFLHILNHALSKPLMFFASGRIHARYGTTKIADIRGVLSTMPLLGVLSFIGVLSLAGTPPLNIFLSEFMVLKAGAEKGLWVAMAIVLASLAVVFYGMLSSFGKMLLSKQPSNKQEMTLQKITGPKVMSNAVMVSIAVCILTLGLRIPSFIDNAIRMSMAAIGVR